MEYHKYGFVFISLGPYLMRGIDEFGMMVGRSITAMPFIYLCNLFTSSCCKVLPEIHNVKCRGDILDKLQIL